MLYQDWPPNAVGFHCRPCERAYDVQCIKASNPPQEWDAAIKIYLANTKPRTKEEATKFRQTMEADIEAAYSRKSDMTKRILILPLIMMIIAVIIAILQMK